LELLAGVGLRTLLAQTGLRSNRPEADGWIKVWSERRNWIKGYPDKRPREVGMVTIEKT
jgi:hypothetical protein